MTVDEFKIVQEPDDSQLDNEDLMEKYMDKLVEKAEERGCDLLVCCRIPDEDGGGNSIFQAAFKAQKGSKSSLPQLMGMLKSILYSIFKDVPEWLFVKVITGVLIKVKDDIWGEKENERDL